MSTRNQPRGLEVVAVSAEAGREMGIGVGPVLGAVGVLGRFLAALLLAGDGAAAETMGAVVGVGTKAGPVGVGAGVPAAPGGFPCMVKC